jgi:hypothetical protein
VSYSISFSYIRSISYGLLVSCSLFLQHELGLNADDGVSQLVEQIEREVSPVDKAAAMKSVVEKRVVALRIKMGKVVVVSNPKLTNGWLHEDQSFQLILDKWT